VPWPPEGRSGTIASRGPAEPPAVYAKRLIARVSPMYTYPSCRTTFEGASRPLMSALGGRSLAAIELPAAGYRYTLPACPSATSKFPPASKAMNLGERSPVAILAMLKPAGSATDRSAGEPSRPASGPARSGAVLAALLAVVALSATNWSPLRSADCAWLVIAPLSNNSNTATTHGALTGGRGYARRREHHVGGQAGPCGRWGRSGRPPRGGSKRAARRSAPCPGAHPRRRAC